MMTVTAVEFDELVGLLREFIRQEVMPAEAGIDETDEIPARLMAQAKEMGLYGYALPAEYGGLGLSVEQRVGWPLNSVTPARRSGRCSAPTTASPGRSSSRPAPTSSASSGCPGWLPARWWPRSR